MCGSCCNKLKNDLHHFLLHSSYSYSLLHPIARASVKDERRNRHDKIGTISKVLCTCKLNHWQDRRYSLTEASDLRLSRGTEFKTEKQK